MKLVREVNGRTITIVPLNSKTLEVTTNGVVTEICYSNDLNRDITSITIAGDYRLTRHGALKIPMSDREVVYEIEHIVQVSPKKFLLLSHLKNRASTYLLPVLGILPLSDTAKTLDLGTKSEISRYCANSYLINAYVDQEDPRFLVLVFRFSNHSTYKILESCLLHHPRYIKTIDGYQQDDYVSFLMEIPDEYHDDVQEFLRGKYSEISDSLKKEILKFHRQTRNTRLGQILYKDRKLKEELEEQLGVILSELQELDSIPDKKNEYLKV